MCKCKSAHSHRHTNIISVSLPAGWLIDCGCSDTLYRIGILSLIGADTNSSRTAGDLENRGSYGKWLGLQAPPDVEETPSDVTLHSRREHVYTVYAPFQRWQSADVWHMRCKSHLTITQKEQISLPVTVSDVVNNAQLKPSLSSKVQYAAKPGCSVFGWPFPITQAGKLVVRRTLQKEAKREPLFV